MESQNNRGAGSLTLLCSVSYFVSYLTRNNFAAVIAAIVAAGEIDKTSAGAVTTLGFITYGIGQLVSGKLGDIINPKKIMFFGFILTAFMNILIPFCPDGRTMCCVWAVNGFAQSMMWPPIVKIMSTAMDTQRYNKGVVFVNWGGTLATIMIYLVSPLVIKLSGWRTVFFISSFSGFLMSAVWIILMTRIEKNSHIIYSMRSGKKGEKKGRSYLISPPLLAIIMIAIMLQGALRDGVTTWVPTYVSEVFSLGSEISILSGVVVPIFGLISLKVTQIIYDRTGKMPFVCSGALFLLAALCCAGVILTGNRAVIPTVIMFALIVAAMHGINLILVCFLPNIYARSDSVSSLSGTLNFMTYVGSALSTYGFAVLSEKSGWNSTVRLWAAVAAAGFIICVVCRVKKPVVEQNVK